MPLRKFSTANDLPTSVIACAWFLKLYTYCVFLDMYLSILYNVFTLYACGPVI